MSLTRTNELENSVVQAFLDGLKPDEKISIAEHARRHFYLPRENNPFPGFFEVEKTPYLKEIMENLEFDNDIEQVVFQKSCQIGGTSVSLCWLLWVANCAINAPSLVVFPNQANSIRFVKKKWRPAVKNCKPLMEKLNSMAIDRESLELFTAPSTTIGFAHARSSSSIRMDSVSIAIADELSNWPRSTGSPGSSNEGDPLEILKGRQNNYTRRKLYCVSTPATDCRISQAYNETDKRKYNVPCPLKDCGEFQTLEWANLKYNKDFSEIYMECIKCGGKIEEHYKTEILSKGIWKATAKSINEKTIGYHINSLYSPLGMMSWKACAEQFEQSKSNPDLYRVFVNNILGEPFNESINSLTVKSLKKNIQNYSISNLDPDPKLPSNKITLITCGVDFNQDFTSLEIVGWCPETLQSWGLNYIKIPHHMSSSELWVELDKVLSKTYRTWDSSKRLRVAATVLDSGYNADLVYSYVLKNLGKGKNIIAVKGIEGKNSSRIISNTPTRTNKAKIPLYTMSSYASNEALYSWLAVKSPKSNAFCAFPKSYPNDYFVELVGMKKVRTQNKTGKPSGRWIQESGKRVEGNDVRRMAIAALMYLSVNIDFDKHSQRIKEKKK